MVRRVQVNRVGLAHLSDSMAAAPKLGNGHGQGHGRAAQRDNNNSALLFCAAMDLT